MWQMAPEILNDRYGLESLESIIAEDIDKEDPRDILQYSIDRTVSYMASIAIPCTVAAFIGNMASGGEGAQQAMKDFAYGALPYLTLLRCRKESQILRMTDERRKEDMRELYLNRLTMAEQIEAKAISISITSPILASLYAIGGLITNSLTSISVDQWMLAYTGAVTAFIYGAIETAKCGVLQDEVYRRAEFLRKANKAAGTSLDG